jgi:hypothetical protein
MLQRMIKATTHTTMKPFKEFIFETTYYRGHPSGADPNKPNRKGITWITPSKELASTYGDEVSEVNFRVSGSRLVIPEINVQGTVVDLLKSASSKPMNSVQQKLYDAVLYHFGGGKQVMELPKFLHKIGSEKVISFLKAMNIKVIQAKEDGVVTFGIIK